MPQRLTTDRHIFGVVLVLIFLGLVIIYSASSVIAGLRYHTPYYFATRQFFWILFSVVVMMLLKKTPYTRLRSPAVAFGAVGVVLILLVLVYLVDPRLHRWIRIGAFSLQPSELAKPALIVFLAYFVTLRARAINDRHTLLPAALIAGGIILLVIAADLGTAIVLGAIAMVVFFVAGLKPRFTAAVFGIALLVAGVAVASKPYRLARIVGYIDPERKLLRRINPGGQVERYLNSSLTTRDTRYQAEQSKIAVGAGGPFGVGLMQGKQKLLYLPEAHTDFIFAVLCEETGLPGSLTVLAGFIIVGWRGLRAATRSADDFGRYLAIGITTAIVFQAFMNMSVVLDMMPTKGIPLPMISSGGSSLLSTLIQAGLLMNVSENAG